mmetsp:Transcript_8275/g.16783  ORF Transcript_8275/g.16783 Transcript_8275/m.16783 type:complete len:205 (-) Transcript_8275:302-916(-)
MDCSWARGPTRNHVLAIHKRLPKVNDRANLAGWSTIVGRNRRLMNVMNPPAPKNMANAAIRCVKDIDVNSPSSFIFRPGIIMEIMNNREKERQIDHVRSVQQVYAAWKNLSAWNPALRPVSHSRTSAHDDAGISSRSDTCPFAFLPEAEVGASTSPNRAGSIERVAFPDPPPAEFDTAVLTFSHELLPTSSICFPNGSILCPKS